MIDLRSYAALDAEPIPYNRFARAYDDMMSHVDYQRWTEYVLRLFELYRAQPRRVLDIGCGTGEIALPLAARGYEMIGIDRAPGMLAEARRKANRAQLSVEWIQADMRDFQIDEPCGAALCLYDSINYMLSREELRQAFEQTREALLPGGLFIFDIISEKNIVAHFDRKTFSENRPDYTFIWKNRYSKLEKMCRTELTFFYRAGDQFERYVETHTQRIFEVKEAKETLKEAGFQFLSAFNAWTTQKYDWRSDRINITARKPF